MADHADDLRVFDEYVRKIETGFHQLAFQPKIDWKFLSSPKSTFSTSTKIVLLAQNPRRKEGNPFNPLSRPSYEDGNAYRLGEFSTPNAKRRAAQVVGLLEHIAKGLQPQVKPEILMDQVLVSNFCPFASPRWEKDLKTNLRVIDFCRELWSGVFAHLNPVVVVCLAADIFPELVGILAKKLKVDPTYHPLIRIGGGSSKFKHELVTFNSGRKTRMILKVPLSSQTYRIMTSDHPEEVEGRNKLIRKITEVLNGN